MVSVLFVCLGNICRSPAAESVLRHLHSQLNSPFELHVDSSGIGDWHVGSPPSEQMRQVALQRGLHLTGRAKKFHAHDLDVYDYVLAADHMVLQQMYHHADSLEKRSKIHLFTEYSTKYHRKEIPDPFHRSDEAFDAVLDMLEECCQELLKHILRSENQR